MSGSNINRALIKQGDSLVWLVRPGILASGAAIDSDWMCKSGIYDSGGEEAIAAASFTGKHTYDGEEYFLVDYTGAQTKELDPGDYTLVIDLSNTTVDPEYSDESHVALQVAQQLIDSLA